MVLFRFSACRWRARFEEEAAAGGGVGLTRHQTRMKRNEGRGAALFPQSMESRALSRLAPDRPRGYSFPEFVEGKKGTLPEGVAASWVVSLVGESGA